MIEVEIGQVDWKWVEGLGNPGDVRVWESVLAKIESSQWLGFRQDADQGWETLGRANISVTQYYFFQVLLIDIDDS